MKAVILYGGQELDYVYLKHLMAKKTRLIWTKNMREMKEILKQLQHIDLMLMELNMEESEKLKAARTLNQFLPETPKIAIVDFLPEKKDREDIYTIFQDIIVKPIKRKTFFETIDKYVTLENHYSG